MDTTSSQPLRAVVYTRVSTGRQAESGLGLVDQLAQATAAVESRGWQVVHFAQDAGISGKSVRQRPGLMLPRGLNPPRTRPPVWVDPNFSYSDPRWQDPATVVTVIEAAHLMGVSPVTVRRWLRTPEHHRHEFPRAIKVGGHWLILMRDLQERPQPVYAPAAA